MRAKIYTIFILSLVFSITTFGQRPGGRPDGGRPDGGRPDGGRPDGGRPDGDRRGDGRPFADDMPNRPDGKRGDWMKPHDTNGDGILEANEFQEAIDRTFKHFDQNGNGVIDPGEMSPPRPENGLPPGRDGLKILPPFFFEGKIRDDQGVTRAQFEQIVRGEFNEMDADKDGTLSAAETRRGHGRRDGDRDGDRDGREGRGQMQPNAKFIAAELRFGDKLVKAQPFSADTIIEDTRRLFDGTTVTRKRSGAIYRDGEGRTRREQPLDLLGGINVVGTDNKPQQLVFINDFTAKTQVFLDLNNKVARRSRLDGDRPNPRPEEPEDAKQESLGTKMMEGVKVEGTRSTFLIPIGELGNDKPIEVVTERWFSPELQVLVMSRHLDPVAGEHVFRLTNIRRAEPSADLFTVPTGYTVEDRKPER